MKNTSETFHDRLAELYIHSLEDESESQGTTFNLSTSIGSGCDEPSLPLDSRNATYSKLVNFLSTSTHYRPDRIFGQLSREGKCNVFVCTLLTVP